MNCNRSLRMWLPVIAAGLIFGLSASTRGAFVSGLVNVDFNTTNGGTPTNASGPAVIGGATDTWNIIDVKAAGHTASNVALVDVTNSSTDVTLGYYGTSSYRVGAGQRSPVNYGLFDEWLSVSGTVHGSITVGGLDTGTTYDLYVYSQSDKTNRAAALTVTGAGTALPGTITNTTDGGATSYISGGNYLKFTLKPDNSGNIGIDFVKAGTDPQKEGDINGFQIIAVPEPTSLSLFGLGSLALLRRKRAQRA